MSPWTVDWLTLHRAKDILIRTYPAGLERLRLPRLNPEKLENKLVLRNSVQALAVGEWRAAATG